nr:Mo-dependent nitrogenase C-terminal domain-containing protein [Chroococcidiopsis sp. SAG 2025]
MRTQWSIKKELCKTIPARCPFAREINLFNYTLFHIPHDRFA